MKFAGIAIVKRGTQIINQKNDLDMGIFIQKTDLGDFLTLDLQKKYAYEGIPEKSKRKNNNQLWGHYLKGIIETLKAKTKVNKVGLLDQG